MTSACISPTGVVHTTHLPGGRDFADAITLKNQGDLQERVRTTRNCRNMQRFFEAEMATQRSMSTCEHGLLTLLVTVNAYTLYDFQQSVSMSQYTSLTQSSNAKLQLSNSQSNRGDPSLAASDWSNCVLHPSIFRSMLAKSAGKLPIGYLQWETAGVMSTAPGGQARLCV